MLNFISADQRIQKPRKVNAIIVGPSKVGKTSLARSLDPATTLFVNGEAGDLALGDWPGTTFNIRDEAMKMGVHPWVLCRAMTCVMGGPDPAAGSDANKASYFYSQPMYEQYVGGIGGPEQFAKFTTIFWDSITVMSRWSFAWSQTSPDAISKAGKYDGLGVYGRHGQEMITWLTNTQHISGKSNILVGILDEDLDEFKRPIYSPQIEGKKTGNEIAGIFDNVITLGLFKVENNVATLDLKKGTERAFVCRPNPWGVPGGDRSGTLLQLEPPNLADLLAKMRAGKRVDGTLNYNAPTAPAAA